MPPRPSSQKKRRKPRRKNSTLTHRGTLPTSDETVRDAQVYLRKIAGLQPGTELSLPSHFEKLRASFQTLKKANNAQHVEAVAHVYALAVAWKHDLLYLPFVELLAADIGKSIGPRTDALHVLLEARIGYGGDSPEARKDAKRLYSRDVQAIRYLASQTIEPSSVLALAEQHGEGLDAWSRRQSTEQRSSSSEETPEAHPEYFLELKKQENGRTILLKRTNVAEKSVQKVQVAFGKLANQYERDRLRKEHDLAE